VWAIRVSPWEIRVGQWGLGGRVCSSSLRVRLLGICLEIITHCSSSRGRHSRIKRNEIRI